MKTAALVSISSSACSTCDAKPVISDWNATQRISHAGWHVRSRHTTTQPVQTHPKTTNDIALLCPIDTNTSTNDLWFAALQPTTKHDQTQLPASCCVVMHTAISQSDACVFCARRCAGNPGHTRCVGNPGHTRCAGNPWAHPVCREPWAQTVCREPWAHTVCRKPLGTHGVQGTMGTDARVVQQETVLIGSSGSGVVVVARTQSHHSVSVAFTFSFLCFHVCTCSTASNFNHGCMFLDPTPKFFETSLEFTCQGRDRLRHIPSVRSEWYKRCDMGPAPNQCKMPTCFF